MFIFYLIFLAVGSLGKKNSLSEKEISIGHEYRNIRRNYGSDPIITDYNAAYIDTDFIHDRRSDTGITVKRNEGYREKFRNHYLIDEGNPDIHGKIQRPCQVYDTFCIRKFFAEHSRCKISGRAVPEPLFRAQTTANYAHANLSATQVNVEYRGINNGRVEEFYINKATDKLVIALNFPSVYTYSNETVLKFYLRGREPIQTRTQGGINTLSYSVTVVIPHLEDLRLDEAEITNFVNNPTLPFILGPGAAASTDPEVAVMLAAFFSNIPLDQKEATLTETNFYAATFIQYNICDFGLKVL